jgi:MFS family permease
MATPLSPEAYEAYIRKNETWNFCVNVADLLFYNFAVSFIYGATILTLYASHLTNVAALIGLIPALQNVGYFLPQLLMARYTERIPIKKILVQKISIMERLPYLFVGLSILLWPQAPNGLAFALLAACLALATFSGGLAGPPWNAMLAKVIRAERRGRFFGLSQAFGGLLGIAGAAVSRQVLAGYPYPTSFGICFLFCFVFQVASWIALTLNREPPLEPTKEAVPFKEYWRRLPTVLRTNVNFSKYLVSRTFIILGGMAGAFYVIYARRQFQISDAFAANLTIAALVSQTVFTPVMGWLADHRGNKWLTEVGTLFGAVTLLLLFFVSDANWFYAVFVLMNISASALMVAGMSIVMEFSSVEDLPTFIALANTLLSVPILLAPIMAGWLVDAVGFQVLFGIALAFMLIGATTIRWMVREPRHERKAVPGA